MGDSKVHRGAYGKPPHVKLIELLLKCPYHEREREKGILVLSLRRGVDRWSIERERESQSQLFRAAKSGTHLSRFPWELGL